MGDRANIVIHDGDAPLIYVYTHWAGMELPGMVADALEKSAVRANIGDGSYFTRTLICQIMDASGDLLNPSGWGISTVIGDGETRCLHVDSATGMVSVSGDGGWVEPAAIRGLSW